MARLSVAKPVLAGRPCLVRGIRIDFDSTLIAGSEELADQLMSTDTLETWLVDPDDSLTYDADRINKP